jgi:hypothetical protein
MSTNSIRVGEAIEIGNAISEYEQAVGAFDINKFLKMNAGQRAAYVKAEAAAAAKVAAVAKKNPIVARKVAPAVKLVKRTSTAMSQMQAAVRSAESRGVTDRMAQATHIIPVCFDTVPTVTASGIATIGAPHNRPWRFLGIVANDAQVSVANPPRLISLQLAGTEHVVTSNVSFSSGAPTQPGVDLINFSAKNQLAMRNEFRWRFWGMGVAGVLRSDAQIKLQVYNPAATSQSVNLSLLVQSSPCGDDDYYTTEKGGVHAANDPQSIKFMNNLARGGMSLFRR